MSHVTVNRIILLLSKKKPSNNKAFKMKSENTLKIQDGKSIWSILIASELKS